MGRENPVPSDYNPVHFFFIKEFTPIVRVNFSGRVVGHSGYDLYIVPCGMQALAHIINARRGGANLGGEKTAKYANFWQSVICFFVYLSTKNTFYLLNVLVYFIVGAKVSSSPIMGKNLRFFLSINFPHHDVDRADDGYHV